MKNILSKRYQFLIHAACLSLFVLVTTIMACSEDEEKVPVKTSSDITVSIDLSKSYQTISGFGAANQMWGSTFPSPANIQSAFGTGENELGLSIFRVRIASNPSEWPSIVTVAKEAQSRGAIILASPWSPPASLKSNNSDVGGHLLTENYEAYAQHINDFISLMTDSGVDIYAISIQNEPDIQVGYESCDWTSVQMRDFLKEYGHLITGAKVAAPESFNFSRGYTDVVLNDDDAAANIDIVAGHIYGGGEGIYSLAETKGKEIWMTEYLMNLNTGNDGVAAWDTYSEEAIWNETMAMLNTVHNAMSNNWNAYIWWYLKRYYSFIGDGTQGTTDGEILKRGVAFSHYSKYIRPGYTRIDIDDEKDTGLQMTAYKGEGQTIAVIVNQKSSSSKIRISLLEAEISTAEAFVTTVNTEQQTQELVIEEDNTIPMTIIGNSITTVILE